MTTRTRIIEAAARLLAESSDADLTTRGVCEAADVAAPALYRQFGDKSGLLTAVVAFGYEQYLASKRALAVSDDPVADMCAGWDNHLAFARANPNYYRLMYAPNATAPEGAAEEAHRLLCDVLDRVATAGRLRPPVEAAAPMIMTANVGAALLAITRPALYGDPANGRRVRDALYSAVIVDYEAEAPAASTRPPRPSPVQALRSRLAQAPADELSFAENAMLAELLGKLSRLPITEATGKEYVMPFANIKVPAGTLNHEQKEEIIHKTTQLLVDYFGEGARPHTMVLVEEVADGGWGRADETVTLEKLGIPVSLAAFRPPLARRRLVSKLNV